MMVVARLVSTFAVVATAIYHLMDNAVAHELRDPFAIDLDAIDDDALRLVLRLPSNHLSRAWLGLRATSTAQSVPQEKATSGPW